MNLQEMRDANTSPIPRAYLPQNALPIERSVAVEGGLQTATDSVVLEFAQKHDLHAHRFDPAGLQTMRHIIIDFHGQPAKLPVLQFCLANAHFAEAPRIEYNLHCLGSHIGAHNGASLAPINALRETILKQFKRPNTRLEGISNFLSGLAIYLIVGGALSHTPILIICGSILLPCWPGYQAFKFIRDIFSPTLNITATANLPGTIPDRWRAVIHAIKGELKLDAHLAYEATWSLESRLVAPDLDPLLLICREHTWYCLGGFDLSPSEELLLRQTLPNPKVTPEVKN